MEEEPTVTKFALNVSLASSLLDVELDQARMVAAAGGSRWKTGIQALDKELPNDLWTGGNVVGIGTMGTAGFGVELHLNLELIATHLIEQLTNPAVLLGEQTRSVFIVAPPSQGTSTIQQLFSIINTRLSQPPPGKLGGRNNQPKQDAKSFLEDVSLLQYLDAPGLLESLAEVSTTLNHVSRTQPQRIVVLVQGLTKILTSLQRRSGLVQTTAIASSILQNLRSIARTSHGSCLILVDLDICWSNANANAFNNYNNSPAGFPPSTNTSSSTKPHSLATAFASATAKSLHLNTHPILAQMVEKNMDVVVAVHDADGRIDARLKSKCAVVEVVRDERLRSLQQSQHQQRAFGRWCVWKGG